MSGPRHAPLAVAAMSMLLAAMGASGHLIAGDPLPGTKALALENARKGITVNAICPGYIATEMVRAMPKDVVEKNILPKIPLGRLGEPEEIARCVVFLASDDASYVNGQAFPVDGGLSSSHPIVPPKL